MLITEGEGEARNTLQQRRIIKRGTLIAIDKGRVELSTSGEKKCCLSKIGSRKKRGYLRKKGWQVFGRKKSVWKIVG